MSGPSSGDHLEEQPSLAPRPIDRLVHAWDGLVADRIPALLGAAAVAVVCGGLAFIAFRPESAQPPVELQLPMATPLATPSADPLPLTVHVAGAVTAPGLYDLAPGTRVADAIAAAGGATSDADFDRVNLAGPVVDGQRLWIPAIGESSPPLVEGPAGAEADPSGPLRLNSATVDQLDQLPGVGPTTATAIIEHREREGPFTAIDELIDVPGIGATKLEQIRPLVTL